MYYEIAADDTGILQDYTPCAPITDRESWEGLSQEWRLESIRLGERFLQYSYPQIGRAHV